MTSHRIVSGMRPTGKLHLGHYHGVLANWLALQQEYDCYFFAADWHSLTTEYENTAAIRENLQEMVLDWLAFGIDPEKSTIFAQSRVPQHAELNLILSMITPLSWLERNPTYKEMQENLAAKDLATYGFLGYPVLMAADIIIYKATKVPVGHDQLPHLEITREIARRFNFLYKPVFPEPAALLTETPKLLGLDGRKMSKSYGNAVFLSDTAAETEKKIMSMVTDVQ
ncbi:MAG TPA: tryptophan--tRNA ligase, partial [Geobacterales bacterium]|nr:tryptophan--tRNA ligase [Geobacterales bacterium]